MSWEVEVEIVKHVVVDLLLFVVNSWKSKTDRLVGL